MNALTLLTNDHRRVDRLFAEHKQASGNARRQKAVFDEIHRELDIHAQIEEQVFYPALEKGFTETLPMQEPLEEARAEHEEVKSLLKQLAGLAPEDAGYAVALTKLIEGVRHHVAEEEGRMFPPAREILGTARLEELGREMSDLKKQLGPDIAKALASAVRAMKKVVGSPAPRRPKAAARRAPPRRSRAASVRSRKAGRSRPATSRAGSRASRGR